MATRPGSAIYNASNKDHNEWQIHAMPIKASFCDAWFTACRKDKFCASDGGSFFSCAAEYKEVDRVAELQAALTLAQGKKDDGMDVGIVAAFAGAGVVICALLAFGCCLVRREKAGKPMFGKLLDGGSSQGGGQTIGGNSA
jgi:folate receptor